MLQRQSGKNIEPRRTQRKNKENTEKMDFKKKFLFVFFSVFSVVRLLSAG